jgi:L1 cell adhesion molecule like protein
MLSECSTEEERTAMSDCELVNFPDTYSESNHAVDVIECDNSSTNLQQAWQGFKLVGDNIDKNIRPSFERINLHTQSLHYYHCFAVLDRVDLSGLSDEANPEITIDLSKLLPSSDDITLMKKHFSTLISRILVRELPEYMADANTVTWHIAHERQLEMSTKSKVVPLGIIPLNENKIDHMCLILDQLHKYVPLKEVTSSAVLPNGELQQIMEENLYEILGGGDQLTVVRARAAIGVRRTHNTNREKLKGIIPVIEDWHGKMTLLQVIFSRLMKASSARERGTLMHLKNLIKASSVPIDPKKNVKATEDFLSKVLSSYIVVAAKEIMKANPTPLTIDELSQLITERYVRLLKGKFGENMNKY